jgi:hypothetical protein
VAPVPSAEPVAAADAAPPAPPAPPDGLLVVYPADEGSAPTPAARAALAQVVETSEDEAGERLASRLPRVARAGPLDELRAAAERLREASVDAAAVPREALLGGRPVRRVKRALFDGDSLRLVEDGGGEDVTIDLNRPTVIVVDGEGPGTAHIYAGGRESPWAIGPATAIAAGSGFGGRGVDGLVERMRGLPEVVSTDLLRVQADAVAQAVQVPNEEAPPATVLSRLLHHAWHSSLGIDLATLRTAVTARVGAASGRLHRFE